MLFITVTDLLDGYRKFYESDKIKEYTCVGADSSFSISFKKKKGDTVSIEVDKEFLCEMDKNSLAKIIFEASSNFVSKYIDRIPKDDPVVEDIINSLSDFEKIL